MADTLDVERLLRDAAAAVDVSGVERVLLAVTGSISAPASRASWWLRVPVRRAGALAAVAALVVTVVLVVSPGTRQAVARRLGLVGVEIVRVEQLPVLPATVGLPDLDLGGATTIDAARADLPYIPRRFPAGTLGSPPAVLRDGTALSYVYRPGPALPETAVGGVGLLLTQFDGETGPPVVRKVLGPDTVAEPVSVGGRPGVWIAGGAHLVAYFGPDGEFVEERVRLAGPVLVWQDGAVTMRLEAALPRDEAIALAATLAP